MERWFAKYPIELKEIYALDEIDKHLHNAKELCKNEEDYLPCLAKVFNMIEDMLEAKNYLSKALPAPRV